MHETEDQCEQNDTGKQQGLQMHQAKQIVIETENDEQKQ